MTEYAILTKNLGFLAYLSLYVIGLFVGPVTVLVYLIRYFIVLSRII